MKESKYPHIDKVWGKNYVKVSKPLDISNKTVYTAMRDNNARAEVLDDIALKYFYNNIAFRTLFQKEEQTTKALREYGVKKGDFVTICVAGIPEMVYSFYACARIGAVANMISPWFDSKDLIARIGDCESDILIIMDEFYPTLKDAIKKSRIKHVVVLPTLNSSLLKYLSKKYKTEKHSNEILWNDFIKDGKYSDAGRPVEYECDLPLAMVYSSGTTGASKGILLSHDSFNNTVARYPELGVDVTRGQTFYQIIPPWFSTGISICINLPITYGCSVFQDPRFERNIFVKNVCKIKPNYTLAPTSMYEGFLTCKIPRNADLSDLIYPFEGGEPLRKVVGDKIYKVMASHGCPSEIKVGYGQCEAGATITSQVHGINSSDGSVGIPLPGVDIGIFDENFNPLSYYERGQILANTASRMLEYYKNPEATAAYFHVDENGVKWNCTGDIGYIDENGELHVLGRASDYSVIGTEKVYNFDVEAVMMDLPEIKMCEVLAQKIGANTYLVAHIILEDEYANDIASGHKNIEDLYDTIQEMIGKKYSNAHIPYYFKIRTSFPYAKSGKRDIAAIQQETDGFIFHAQTIPSTRKRK